MVIASYTPAVKKVISHGRFRRTMPVLLTERFHATSTMDLVSLDEKVMRQRTIRSTLQFTIGERDYSGMIQRNIRDEDERQWNALLGAVSESFQNNDIRVPYITRAEELDLVQAAERRQFFDKVFLLLNHGEHAMQDDMSNYVEESTMVDVLSGKGVGQALSLARRTAAFCNKETGLIPNLFVVEPSVAATQTTFLSFPYETPFCSLSQSRWVCHPALVGMRSKQHPMIRHKMESIGIDSSLIDNDNSQTPTAPCDLLRNANKLINWLHSVDEKVVVGTFLSKTVGKSSVSLFSNCLVLAFHFSLR
jgi:hypothetical protein